MFWFFLNSEYRLYFFVIDKKRKWNKEHKVILQHVKKDFVLTIFGMKSKWNLLLLAMYNYFLLNCNV